MKRAEGELSRIGEIARRTGLSPDTLRHYERLGVLTCAGRTAGGYRLYAPEAERRVRTIQAALALGFTLRELALLFRARAKGSPPCRAARRIADERLAEVERELARLSRLRDALRGVVERWDERLARTRQGEFALLLDALAEVDSGQRGGSNGGNETLRPRPARRALVAVRGRV